ncbi:MAG: hypothetical protein HYY93_07525 [Planctomycetes bacterium]|nr:hypothetical protein [Planctomycetota bacterium]
MRRLVPLCLVLLAAAVSAAPPSLDRHYVSRRDNAVKNAIDDLMSLGKWARDHGLPITARHAWRTILLLDPKNAAATQALKSRDSSASVKEPVKEIENYEEKWQKSIEKHRKAFRDLMKWAHEEKLKEEEADARALLLHVQNPPTEGYSPEELTVLQDANRHRGEAGVSLVRLDRKMNDAALKHAKYLTRNAGHPTLEGLGAHHEQASLPGYTPEGAKAGEGGNIIHSRPEGAVDCWMATLYHRIPILHPRLRKIGSGFDEEKGIWAGVLYLSDGHDPEAEMEPEFVRYPADGQTGVFREFAVGEIPNPLPSDARDPGYPVTLTLYDGSRLGSETARLSLKGTDGQAGPDIECYFSSPAKPATDFPQGGTICLIPKKPLAEGTRYEAEFRMKRNSKTVVEKWEFTTR